MDGIEGVEEHEVEGVAGQPVTLPIAGGPATGHRWFLDLPAGVEQIDDGPQRDPDPGAALGAAAGGYLRVVAERGEHVVAARLARPWEPDSPVRRVRIRLLVR
jgi:predicted secreted protein